MVYGETTVHFWLENEIRASEELGRESTRTGSLVPLFAAQVEIECFLSITSLDTLAAPCPPILATNRHSSQLSLCFSSRV
jgi:hypothetical protein